MPLSNHTLPAGNAAAPAYGFLIYGRAWCHLCDDMHEALQGALGAALTALPGAFTHAIEMVDIDVLGVSDPALLERYDELVPVLLASKNGAAAQELCHYHLDLQRLASFLSA